VINARCQNVLINAFVVEHLSFACGLEGAE
jgi:hypothetical protein